MQNCKEFQNELALLQKKIQGLEDKLTLNPNKSSKSCIKNSKNSDECFTFHNTEVKDSLNYHNKELDILKQRTSPLRIKKKPDFNEGCVSVNESLYNTRDKEFSSVANSSNFMKHSQIDRENISLHSNHNYAMSQKGVIRGLKDLPKNIDYSKMDMIDKNEFVCNPLITPKYESAFDSEITIPQSNPENLRVLDSRMTDEELFVEKETPAALSTNNNRTVRNRKNVASIILNNSYDDINKRKGKKTATNTYRRERGDKIEHKSSILNNKDSLKNRSISMRSTRNKTSVLRAGRILSESGSEKSFHHKSKDRSLSMSLRNEKNELKDTMKKIKYEDKHINIYQKVDEIQEKLVKERKKNYELRKTMEQMQKKIDKNEKYAKKIKEIKQDYNELLDSFEKSEQIRKSQKELINSLRAENTKLKSKGKPSTTETTERTKSKKSKKKSIDRSKGSSRRKIKKM